MTYCQLQQKSRFLFLTSLYHQIDGVMMANAFFHYEKEWLR